MLRPKYIIISSVGILVIVIAALSVHFLQKKKTPEEVLKDFYNYDSPEVTLMDPLILAGEDVVPLVIEEIKDPFMPRRRYAIGFLGNGSYKKALPVLKSILANKNEKDLFRGDVLRAIYLINQKQGLKLAKQYSGRDDFLGYTAKEIITNKIDLNDRRTYQEALSGGDD